MIILLVQLIIILVLILILTLLVLDERKHRASHMHTAKLRGYWDGRERRSVDRLNIPLQVTYRTNGHLADVESVDISTKGIRLLLDERITKGTPLKLEIKLPESEHLIRASGGVVWSEESKEPEENASKRFFSTGIKFWKFKGNDEKRLVEFINGLRASVKI